jgi:hypothetical protein
MIDSARLDRTVCGDVSKRTRGAKDVGGTDNSIGSSDMKATEKLHNAGQNLWLDNITCDLQTSGTIKRYIDTPSVTGLTSNPTILGSSLKGVGKSEFGAGKRSVRGDRV